jgi:hypothetical protein
MNGGASNTSVPKEAVLRLSLTGLARHPSRRGPTRQTIGRRTVRYLAQSFWGPVADNGRSFEQMNLHKDIKNRIETVVSLPAFTDELFPQDIASMLKARLTFKEAIESLRLDSLAV